MLRLICWGNVTYGSPGCDTYRLNYVGMSFYDDLVEPEAIESAAHFAELIQMPVDRVELAKVEDARRFRVETRRALPRDLGN